MTARDTLYLLRHDAENNPNYASWIHGVDLPYQVIDEPQFDWDIPANAAMIVTHNQYRYEEVSILRRARELQIPTLVLADGILEYRNTWENPNLPDGAIYQPVIGHKLACIGRSQQRLVEAWNEPGTVELVGIPRLDGCLQPHHTTRVVDGEFHLLIATARTPGFTPEQMAVTRQSLVDIRDWLASHPTINGERIVPTWRISPQLADELQVASNPHNVYQGELIQALAQVDAVMTTPSTVALEGMLAGRPVVWLDYHLVPPLINVVWTIQCQKHIEPVLNELLAPPPQKLDLQRTFLLDSLECQSPARDRLIKLVTEMTRLGQEAHQQQHNLVLPPRILVDKAHESSLFQTHHEQTGSPRQDSIQDASRLEQVALDHANRLIAELQLRLEQVSSELQQQQHEARKLNTKTDRLQAQLEEARELQQDTRNELRQAREQAKEAAHELTQAQRQVTEHQKSVNQLTNRLALEEKAVERLREDLQNTRRELSQRTREQETLSNKLTRTQARLGEHRRRAKRLENQLQTLTSHWLVGKSIRLSRIEVDLAQLPDSHQEAPEDDSQRVNSDDLS